MGCVDYVNLLTFLSLIVIFLKLLLLLHFRLYLNSHFPMIPRDLIALIKMKKKWKCVEATLRVSKILFCSLIC